MPNDLRVTILEPQRTNENKILELDGSVQSLLQKLNLDTSGQQLHKKKISKSAGLAQFACFSYFFPNILPKIVVCS